MRYMLDIGAPEADAVTLDVIKAHLRIDGNDEDTILGVYLAAATKLTEEQCRRAWVTQEHTMTLPAFPAIARYIQLPRAPAQTVDSIEYTDANGDTQTMDPSDYALEPGGSSRPQRVWLVDGANWPSGLADSGMAVTITYTAGYGDDEATTPALATAAICQLVAHWHENRESVAVGTITSTVPMSTQRLLDLLTLPEFPCAF